jgi:hypothetical protein
MEEADIQIAETKKASYEFNRDIVQGSVNTVCTDVFVIYLCMVSFQIFRFHFLLSFLENK